MLEPHGSSEAISSCEKQRIPPKPDILIALHELLNSGAPDVMVMSDLISHDVGLSSAVLHNINSAYFGLRRHVSDIRQAVVMLGSDKVANLVSGYELRKALTGKSCISLERFWDSASDVAEVCAWIARSTPLAVPVEDVYAVGLFHDCGIPVMSMCFDDYREFLEQCNSNYQQPMTALENEHYGVNHALVGYRLTESWDLPAIICDVILQHHEPDVWGGIDDFNSRQALAVLKLAEKIVDRHRRHKQNIDWERNLEQVCQAMEIDLAGCESLEGKVLQQWPG